MTPNNAFTLSRSTAHQVLKQFDCLKPGEAKSDDRLRQALLQIAQHSDYQILGICADSIAQGQQALTSYTQALGYTVDAQLALIEGAVYIKFNPKSGLCYADSYSGAYRGVLVSCQSDDASEVNEMYGHLPLGLFEEVA
jgi:Domain of unknown function (DUF1824)